MRYSVDIFTLSYYIVKFKVKNNLLMTVTSSKQGFEILFSLNSLEIANGSQSVVYLNCQSNISWKIYCFRVANNAILFKIK